MERVRLTKFAKDSTEFNSIFKEIVKYTENDV